MKCKFLAVLPFLVAFSALNSGAFAQSDDFLRGESLFRENKIEEAVPYLRNAVNGGRHPKAYNYLALSLHAMGLYQEALDICSEGMKAHDTDKKIIAFNAGNVCFDMGDYYSAERWFSLAIAANRIYAPPVLNRANALFMQGKYYQSLEDYKTYLDLSPNDRQKPEIEQIIAMIEGMRKAEEERIAEELRLREEEERIIAEQKRQAEEYAAYLAEQRRLEEERQRREEEARIRAEAEAAANARLELQKAEIQALLREQDNRLEAQRLEYERKLAEQKMLEEERRMREAELTAQAKEEALAAQEEARAAQERQLLLMSEIEARLKEQEARQEAQRLEYEARLAEQKKAEEERLLREAEERKRAQEERAAQELLERQQAEARYREQEERLNAQREEIQKMLEEQRNAQQEILRAELERQNKKAEEDAARRRKLLEDVATSLQNSSTSNMSAGAEGTVDYGYGSELE